jgi:hypothetical protein
VYVLDESAKVATLIVNDDMGNFSWAFGWAQTLRNGDYAWTSGYQSARPGGVFGIGQGEEFTAAGVKNLVLTANLPVYRIYRLASMYGF